MVGRSHTIGWGYQSVCRGGDENCCVAVSEAGRKREQECTAEGGAKAREARQAGPASFAGRRPARTGTTEVAACCAVRCGIVECRDRVCISTYHLVVYWGTVQQLKTQDGIETPFEKAPEMVEC